MVKFKIYVHYIDCVIAILHHKICFANFTKPNCRKIPLIRPGYMQTKSKFDGCIFGGDYLRGAYIWEEKHFNLQLLNVIFFFLQYKAHILAFMEV